MARGLSAVRVFCDWGTLFGQATGNGSEWESDFNLPRTLCSLNLLRRLHGNTSGIGEIRRRDYHKTDLLVVTGHIDGCAIELQPADTWARPYTSLSLGP